MAFGRAAVQGAIAAVLVLAVLVVPQAATAAPGTSVTWEERSWSRQVPAGTATTQTMVFRAADSVQRVKAPNIRISGPVAAAVSAAACDISWLGGNRYELTVDVTLPLDATKALTGSLVLRDGKANIGPAVPLRVVPLAAPSGTIPLGTVDPSSDRIG